MIEMTENKIVIRLKQMRIEVQTPKKILSTTLTSGSFFFSKFES